MEIHTDRNDENNETPRVLFRIGCVPLIVILAIHLLGCAVAAGVSWAANHSIYWAIVNSVLGWFYVAFKTAVIIYS